MEKRTGRKILGIGIPRAGGRLVHAKAALRLLMLSWWLGWWVTLEIIQWRNSQGDSIIMQEWLAGGHSPNDIPRQYLAVGIMLMEPTANRVSLAIAVVLFCFMWVIPRFLRGDERPWHGTDRQETLFGYPAWRAILVVTWLYCSAGLAATLLGEALGTPLDLVTPPAVSWSWHVATYTVVIMVITAPIIYFMGFRRPKRTAPSPTAPLPSSIGDDCLSDRRTS